MTTSRIPTPPPAEPLRLATDPAERSPADWGSAIVGLLIVCAAALSIARIATCRSSDPNRPVPFHSANDRSRWATVRALVDHGTFAIDPVLEARDGGWWDSIDKVRAVGRDGAMHSYSSKPPLWPTFLAGQYWLLKRLFGLSIADDPFTVVRWLLIANNALGLVLLMGALDRIAREWALNPWTRAFLVASAGFGTALSTFTVTLNNHLPAAVLTALALRILVVSWRRGVNTAGAAGGGLFSAAAAALELPAAAWAAAALLLVGSRSPRAAVLGFLPAAGLIAAAFFGTNYWAIGQWRPAYAQRQDGREITRVGGDFRSELDAGRLPEPLRAAIDQYRQSQGQQPLSAETLAPGVGIRHGEPTQGRWIVNFGEPDQLVIAGPPDAAAGSADYALRAWGNWYEYPQSYWLATQSRKSEVDIGERDGTRYAFHLVLGHHGILSLTPIFWISLCGVTGLLLADRFGLRLPTAAMVAVSVIVLAFYLTRSPAERNYGGVTSAARWFFWLYPFWLLWMVPALEAAVFRRGLRWLALLLLGASVASAAFALANPWVHPWIYQWMQIHGWDV